MGHGTEDLGPQVHRIGSYAVTGQDRANNPGPEMHVERNALSQNQTHRPLSFFAQSQRPRAAAVPRTTHKLEGTAFLMVSQSLEQYLTESFHRILHQIQRWYPEEMHSMNEDEMDWQPEDVVSIPVMAAVHYVWDPAPNETQEVQEAKESQG
jgi:hypothetical protein